LEGQTNLTIGGYNLWTLPKGYIGFGISHYFTNLLTIVPPGRPYSGTEKLLLPFSMKLWVAIVMVIVMEVAVHHGFKRFRTNVDSVKNDDYLTIVRIIVGTVATSVPKKGSGRIIFISFVLYCLVLRCVYMTKLYGFMRQQKNRSQILSYDEALDTGVHIYAGKEFLPIFNTVPTKRLVRI
jgi:hypothetical protein